MHENWEYLFIWNSAAALPINLNEYEMIEQRYQNSHEFRFVGCVQWCSIFTWNWKKRKTN